MVEMKIGRFPQLEFQAKEAINTLCANLSFVGKDIKKVLMTSCRPGEGKSSISIELMRTFASMGLKTVLVDADIRASSLQGRYDIQINTHSDAPYSGLTRYLAGYCSINDILGSTNIRGAYMILAGRTVTNSLPLVSSARMDKLIEELGRSFDIVLVDAPPLGAVIDAAKLARCCDGVLFVLKSGMIPARELKEAMIQMSKTGIQILGTVLNQYDDKKYGRGYYKKSHYANYTDAGKHSSAAKRSDK